MSGEGLVVAARYGNGSAGTENEKEWMFTSELVIKNL